MRKLMLSAIALMAFGVSCGGSMDDGQPLTQPLSKAEVTAVATQLPQSDSFKVKRANLVANQAGTGASAVDEQLLNAWGLAFAPTGRAWVASNGAGTAQVYDDSGTRLLSVTIPNPADPNAPSAPTGQVFNASDSFAKDRFILATEDGTLAGWDGSDATHAVIRADRSDSNAIYKGVAIARDQGKPFLYATDFRNNRVDVFDENYQLVTQPDRFVDPDLPAGYAPFNVMGVGPVVFVTYAQQSADKVDDEQGPGKGYVDAFDASGRSHVRIASQGALDAPWGMALRAPATETLAVDLLVGNFGDGRINVYRLAATDFKPTVLSLGPLQDAATGQPITIDGLWALQFGPGAGGFEKDDLYFTAGPGDEEHGVFGELAF